MTKIDMWEWPQWKHPRTDQFLERLAEMNFADRYDALCRSHSVGAAKLTPDQLVATRSSLSLA